MKILCNYDTVLSYFTNVSAIYITTIPDETETSFEKSRR